MITAIDAVNAVAKAHGAGMLALGFLCFVLVMVIVVVIAVLSQYK